MSQRLSPREAPSTVLFLSFVLAALLVSIAAGQETTATQGDSRGVVVRIKDENSQVAQVRLYDESHALVIGVSNYKNGWNSLKGVPGDVIAVASVLKNQGFTVKTEINPTGEALDRAIKDFISECGQKERNRVLIYFAGHGHTEELKDGRDVGYIVPADAPLPDRDPQQFSRRAISMDEIESFAKKIKSKHALFVFDSCFSGSIFEVRSIARPPSAIESSTAAPVRQFITAGTKNQTVPDQSKFRVYFVRAFEQREGDLNRDGYITGEELGHYLAGRVAKETWDAQTPRHGKINDGYLNQGDFVFELPRPENQHAGVPEDPEDSFWIKIVKNDDPQGFETYWSTYCPAGKYCHAAVEKLRSYRANQRTSQFSAPVTIQRKEAWAAQNRAEQFRVRGDLEAAIEESNKAIRLDPAYADAYASRGHSHSQMANYKRAIDDYTEAARLDPTNKNVFQNRGYCYSQLGEFDRAVGDYTRALLIDPNDFLLFHNRGVAYNNKRDYKKAVADFTETIKLNPNYVQAYINRAFIYRALGKTDLAVADESAAQRLTGK